MDSTKYTNLTGKTVAAGQTDRFAMQQKVAKRMLERMLGYPLCPSDWGNQYLESGKTDGCFESLTDAGDLEDPDDVQNAYRLYRWNPSDQNIYIDPATQIHAVKLVQGDVTIKTFESDDFQPQWENWGDEPFARFLSVRRGYLRNQNGCYWQGDRGLMVAVDADWAFEPLPLELQQVWAALIEHGMDDKSNIRSESAGTHSYSKFGPEDPTVQYADVIERYAGPNRPGGDPGVA